MLAGRLDENYSVEVRSAITPLTIAKVMASGTFRFVAPFIATIASGLHVSLATMGAAIAISEFVGLSAPLIARVAGVLQRRKTMVLGLTGMALSAIVVATSPGIVQFTIGLTLLGITKIVFDLSLIAWITDRVEYVRVGRAIGLTETAWAIGLFTVVVAMGLLTGLTSWRWAYVLAVVVIAGMAAVLRRVLPDEPVRRRPAQESHGTFRLGSGWWAVAATVALAASAQAMFVTFGKWLEEDFGYSDTKIAVVIFGFGAVELVAALGSSHLADVWGKQRAVMIGAGTSVPFALALALLHSHVAVGLLLLAAFIVAFEFSIVSSISLSNSLVPSNPSIGLSAVVSGATLGRAAMSPVATAAFTAHGMWLPASLAAGCGAATVACHARHRSRALSPSPRTTGG